MNFKKNIVSNLNNIRNNKNYRKNICYLTNKKIFYKNTIKILYNILVVSYDTEKITDIYNKINNKKKLTFEACYGSNNLKISIKKFYEFNNIDDFFLCSTYIKKNKKNYNSFIIDLNRFKYIKKYNNFISNPPYIKKKEYINLNFENKNLKHSLISNENGLKKIKNIIININDNKLVNSNIMIENSYNQNKKMNKISRKKGFIKVYSKKNITIFES